MKALLILLVLPPRIAGFSLPLDYNSYCSAAHRRLSSPLFHHDDESSLVSQQDNTPTILRAKDCMEHFGECSIPELKDLQSKLSKQEQETSFTLPLIQQHRQVARLEQGIAHQLDLLQQHQQHNAFVTNNDSSEPALVERVRECVHAFGECTMAEMEHLKSTLHEMAESNPKLFQNDPSEEEWLEDGLSLQVRLLKNKNHLNTPHCHTPLAPSSTASSSSSSLYPESPLIDRARLCTEEFGECSLNELEVLYEGLSQVSEVDFENESEKTWLQQGLALQLEIMQRGPNPSKRVTHKHKFKKQAPASSVSLSLPSLYPEVPIVDEARECAENFGACSLEQLESVQHRLEEMIQLFQSFEGMQLFTDKAEQVWVQDGLALQIKLFTKQRKGQGEASSSSTTTTTLNRRPSVPTNIQDEIYFLYPEHSAIDRARDCADEYGKCSLEEMQDLIPILQHHREMAALHNVHVDETDASASCLDNDDEIKWLQEGLELQIALRQPARRRMERNEYNRMT